MIEKITFLKIDFFKILFIFDVQKTCIAKLAESPPRTLTAPTGVSLYEEQSVMFVRSLMVSYFTLTVETAHCKQVFISETVIFMLRLNYFHILYVV